MSSMPFHHGRSPDPDGRTSIITRIRVVASLLGGVRPRDFRSARRFIRMRFPGEPRAIQLAKFVAWAARLMWQRIPDATSWTSIDRPVVRVPYWLTAENPLANHPWRMHPEERIPETADVVVVGAGFGGTAVAYHWAKLAASSLVLIEKNDPADGAAGRNAGILVAGGGELHGYYVFAPVLAYLTRTRPELTERQRRATAAEFARTYVRALEASHESIRQAIETDHIDCDYERKGWVIFTDEEDRARLEASLALGEQLGWEGWVPASPEEIERRCGLRTTFGGGVSPGAATWNPAKWVWGALQVALREPTVKLFTQTTAQTVTREGSLYRVQTDRGTIRSPIVVNATEAYTKQLFRDFLAPFPDLITPTRSQGMAGDGGPAALAPGTPVAGPLGWFSREKGGKLLFGSDNYPIPADQADRNLPSRFITWFMCSELGRHWRPEPVRVTHEWTGSAGQAPDRFPVVGLLDGHGLYTLGGYAGAGSAVSFNAGLHVVNTILGRPCNPEFHPPEFYSPMRFVDPVRYGPLDRNQPAGVPESSGTRP